MRPTLFAVLLLALACGPVAPGPSDASGSNDAGGTIDAGEPEDAGDTTDAGDVPDAGLTLPLEGFGALSGACDVLDDELTADDDFVIRNTIDFGTNAFDASEKALLSDGGERLYDTPNAGGSSGLSEVFSYEVLYRCELAELLKTETEVGYDDPNSKITDILMRIDGLKIGVSVVRAVSYPRNATWPESEATRILTKKLEGVHDSTLHVVAADRWEKQIIHAIAYSPQHADALAAAWAALDDTFRGDTVLLITQTDGDDEFIYSNQ